MHFPYIAIDLGLETVIEDVHAKQPATWFPTTMGRNYTHPGGRMWTGGWGWGDSTIVFRLEGTAMQ
jgi:hypothetical protein